MFYDIQDEEQKQLYTQLLQITCSLSNLFSDSVDPFLYYRAMENIFCKAFNATNYARSDISVDSGKGNVGLGLKTFLHKNGKTLQKIAEFNKEAYLLTGLKPEEIAIKVSIMRNERIVTAKRICKIDDVIYHLLTRKAGIVGIYEEPMDFIDINNIKNVKAKKKIVSFDDGIHEYSFNGSKSTLFKRFYTLSSSLVDEFEVGILDDPFDFLLGLNGNKSHVGILSNKNEIKDYIILPLYSPSTGEVQLKSGLNQWNANGRARDPNEVYINIPAWIHRCKKGFFNYVTSDFKTDSFDVRLPSGDILNMKVAQQGGKALMSNPNKALGYWILREILRIKEGEILTKTKLDIIGIDSVMLSKDINGEYFLDFLRSGSYEEFENEYKR